MAIIMAVVLLAAVATAVLSAHADKERQTMAKSDAIPAIDTIMPARTETATFAMG